MTDREYLWILMDYLASGKIDIEYFCDEFTRIYDLELKQDTLNEFEREDFQELNTIAGRFSNSEEDLKIPNMYYTEEDVRNEVSKIRFQYGRS